MFVRGARAAWAYGARAASGRYALPRMVPRTAMATTLVTLGGCALASPLLADALFEAPPNTEHRFPLCSFLAWGSNKNGVSAPGEKASTVPLPKVLQVLDGVSWRDVQLNDTCAVAVDASGDIVQWGGGFDAAPDTAPTKTLTGMDIQRVQLSGGKVYALSRSGHVYVFSQARERQQPEKTSWLSPSVDAVKLSANEKFADIVAGDHHVLGLSRQGRVYSIPADNLANEYGQLGYSTVHLGHAESERTCEVLLEPLVVRKKRAATGSAPTASDPEPTRSSTDIRYATSWRLIPSLSDSTFAEIAAGTAHSVVRTEDGRVLSWGQNSNGQLGLGAHVTFETIAVPREVEFPLSVVGRHAKCTRIAAGGANTFFVLHSRGAPMASDDGPTKANERVDVLAVGAGQRGTLGNGQRNQSCGVPVRVKVISGMQEYSEAHRGMRPIDVHAITVGDSGQCAVVMEAPSLGEQTRRDVYVWGDNSASQLANGKKGHTAVPALLSMVDKTESSKDPDGDSVLVRVLLVEQVKARAKSFAGRERTFADIEQRIVAGGSCMALYAGVA
ncbi:hypothetical protein MCAP1_001887 [Malassezia caprae]|uniref:Regulator of chromosome condensation 1/beta-lactamase-inhibitor protein II n=1 Tax=Malassezia caprae TaxID=1381934 RepID=A0AAF0EAK2_9BASI|nr:hypothetical protein MCAP1_001887 [Malassezia caprae]